MNRSGIVMHTAKKSHAIGFKKLVFKLISHFGVGYLKVHQ